VGLRFAADGKHPGLPIIILGGEHGDIPLEPSAGELVAKLVVEQRVSVLLDLGNFRKHEVATFTAIFLETLYRLKNHEAYRTPMMLIIDEADAIAPQKPHHGEERMLGAAEDIVRRGGQRGIGCMLVTQRSAVINKNVLTQAQILIALRTIAPQDLAALNAWIDVHGTPEERSKLMASLPALPKGEAWVWSPGWPDDSGIFKHIGKTQIKTFDSGETPKPGQKRVEPKNAAAIDLEALRVQMAETVERAKESDPRALRAELARLRAELAKKTAVMGKGMAVLAKEKRVEVPVMKDGQVKRLEAVAEKLVYVATSMEMLAKEVLAPVRALAARPTPPPYAVGPVARLPPTAPRRVAQELGRRVSDVDARLPPHPEQAVKKGAREMLRWLARMRELTRDQLGTLAGMSTRSGTFANYLGALRTNGFVVDRGKRLAITDAGDEFIGPVDVVPPTTNELLAVWSGKLKKGAREMLQILVDAYPNAVLRDQLGELAGISPRSGTFANYLGSLRSNGLVDDRDDGIAAGAALFIGAQ
jgi:hypothetical protein